MFGKIGMSLFFINFKSFPGSIRFLYKLFLTARWLLDSLTSRCKMWSFCLQDKLVGFYRCLRSMSYLFLFRQQCDTVSKRSSSNPPWQQASSLLKCAHWIIHQQCVLSAADPSLFSLLWREGEPVMSYSVTDQYSITKISLISKLSKSTDWYITIWWSGLWA